VTFDEHGSMCIGILKPEAWKPSSKILSVLLATQQLLVEPVPDDAVETSAAEKFKNDRKAYEKEVREFVKKYAK
jgi:ubiquitin-protein ligase